MGPSSTIQLIEVSSLMSIGLVPQFVVNTYLPLKCHFKYHNMNAKLFVTLYSESSHNEFLILITNCARSTGLTPDVITKVQ